MNASEILSDLVRIAGIGQLVLVVFSLAIPRMLGWKEETAKLRPLTRQVFWTYATYIWAINLFFGLISTLAPAWLLNRSELAGAVASFIALYWLGRLVIQFVVFDRNDAGRGPFFRLAEIALVSLFIFLALVYSLAALFDVGELAT